MTLQQCSGFFPYPQAYTLITKGTREKGRFRHARKILLGKDCKSISISISKRICDPNEILPVNGSEKIDLM